MAGVWVFKKGVMRLVEKPGNKEQVSSSSSAAAGRRKVLLHTPSEEVIACYASLERKLAALGWEKYYEDPELLQFHRRSSIDLISLPKDFARFNSIHMYDIVVKNRDAFKVVENH